MIVYHSQSIFSFDLSKPQKSIDIVSSSYMHLILFSLNFSLALGMQLSLKRLITHICKVTLPYS